MIWEKKTRTNTLIHILSLVEPSVWATHSHSHLYLSVVTYFRCLRARGLVFWSSLNKFGVGVSGETKKLISYVEALENLSPPRDCKWIFFIFSFIHLVNSWTVLKEFNQRVFTWRPLVSKILSFLNDVMSMMSWSYHTNLNFTSMLL